MIDISLVDSEIQVSSNGVVYKTYATTVNNSYRFDSSSRLQLTIDGQPYQIPFANLTLNGAAPASEAAALATLSEIFASGGDSSASYLVYAALLSQSGTDAPVATILENTLGDIPEPQYSSVGFFKLFSIGLFPANKVICFVTLDWNSQVLDEYIVSAARLTDDEVGIFVFDSAFSAQNGFSNMSIEIRVYP